MKKIIFVGYHQRDINFYLKLRSKLTDLYNVKILSFVNYKSSFNLKNDEYIYYKKLDFEPSQKFKFNIQDNFFFHEIQNSDLTSLDLRKRSELFKKIISNLYINEKPDIIIHELGGFLIHHMFLDFCKKNLIKHIFIEPSPLKKHSFFLIDCFNIEESVELDHENKASYCDKYYDETLKLNYVSYNAKDKHFNIGLTKIFISGHYYKTFIFKIIKKIKGEFQIFDNLKFFIKTFFMRIKNKVINNFCEKIIVSFKNNFIYFAAQAPYDMAITCRARPCFDQISKLLDIIRDIDSPIIFKEHPLFEGTYNYLKIRKAANECGNKIVIAKHNALSSTFSENSDINIVINSKAGLEALVRGKLVVALHENYYSGDGLAVLCKTSADLKKIIANKSNYLPSESKVKERVLSIFNKVLYFNLYDICDENLNKSSKSIKFIIGKFF